MCILIIATEISFLIAYVSLKSKLLKKSGFLKIFTGYAMNSVDTQRVELQSFGSPAKRLKGPQSIVIVREGEIIPP